MRIRIDPPTKDGTVFYLSTDQYNFIAESMGVIEKGKNAGEIGVKKRHYYSTLQGAITEIVSFHLLESDATRIGELQQEVAALRQWLADNVPKIIASARTPECSAHQKEE